MNKIEEELIDQWRVYASALEQQCAKHLSYLSRCRIAGEPELLSPVYTKLITSLRKLLEEFIAENPGLDLDGKLEQ